VTVLLDVRDLAVSYASDAGDMGAVNGVSFALHAGETVGLVGESGCGKTSVGFALIRVLAAGARIGRESRILFEGADLLALDERAMRDLRGRKLSMIFQEPAAALNPVMKVGAQVAEAALLHGERSKRAAWDRAVAMLDRTGIADAARCAHRYPHELSGGMRQRVLIAAAFAMEPKLIIADEPTTALDVTVQKQILRLIRAMQRAHGTAVVFVTHDLGVVAQICDSVTLLFGGCVIEAGPVAQVMESPRHAYARALLEACPRHDGPNEGLKPIPESVIVDLRAELELRS
jgi:peptide/nickel transport system ATP-binding protein